MKRIILVLLVVVAFSFNTQEVAAQEISPHAIGLRFGDSDGFGPEINYQHALRENNRLELGLSWHSRRHHDAIKLIGIYQWVWNIEGGFNWFAGPGVGLGNVSYNYDHHHHDYGRDSEFFAFISGAIGIEYSFNIPLMISLDARPQLNLGYNNDLGFDVGLGIRYQF